MNPELDLEGDLRQGPVGDVSAELAPAARLAALGAIVPAAIHELNNWLFGVVAQTELLLTEPGLDAAVEDRLRVIGDSGAGLQVVLRRLSATARGDLAPGPLQLDEEVRTVLALPGFGESAFAAPADPVHVAGAPEKVAQIVLHALVSLLATAPSVELVTENGTALLSARPTRARRALREDDGGFGVTVAQALARSLGGSLERLDDTGVRLSLPLV